MASFEHNPLSPSDVADALAPYGFSLEPEQLNAISSYVQVLLRWNKTVNLTAIEDPYEIVARHFGESLFAATIDPDLHGRLADVGAGAGFPGVALKIAFPRLRLTLIESNKKKCAFLNEIKGELRLSGVDIFHKRYEEVVPPSGFDFICSRAMGNYSALLHWAVRSLSPSGKIILWLGADDSVKLSKSSGWNWDLPTKIPNSMRRLIQVGSPVT